MSEKPYIETMLSESELDDYVNVCECFGGKKMCTFAHYCEVHCPTNIESEAPMGCGDSCPFEGLDE